MLGAAACAFCAGQRASVIGAPGTPLSTLTYVSIYQFSGNKLGVQWTNGESSVTIEIGKSSSSSVQPSSVSWTRPAGTTSYDVGEVGYVYGSGTPWVYWIRYNDGVNVSDWVASSNYAGSSQ